MSLRLRAIVLSAVSTVALSATLTAQPKTESITPSEYREARRLSLRFERRLLRTRDIRPLMREFFVPGFFRNLDVEDFPDWTIRADQITPERRAMLERFYYAQFNWMYLYLLCDETRRKTGSPAYSEDPLQDLPLEIRKAILSPLGHWNAILTNDENNYLKKPPTSVEANTYFDNTLHLLEKTEPLLRKYSFKIKAGRNVSSSQKTNTWGDFLKIKSRAYACDHCFGFEKGTRMVVTGFPFLGLILTRSKGSLKIVSLELATD